MNITKKLFCRSFQLAFRAVLPLLPYRNPGILNHIEDVPTLLLKNNKCRPLLVTDKNIRGLGLTKTLEHSLELMGFHCAVFDETEQNPTASMVDRALAVYKTEQCDCLIAFGGGSPMDCAKAVGALIARPNKSLAQMEGILKVMHKTPLTVAIPTTAGTGSETTLAAVIVDDATRHKYAINDFPLIPDYAVLDAATIHTLPFHIAASTGMDALTHAVEAYIGRSTTASTRRDALEAVRLIFENIDNASAHLSVEAEQNMLLASHLAGRAFTRSYVGYIHAVSHSISGKYNSPHGLTNAILLPKVLEMYGEAAYKKLAELCIAAGLGSKEEGASALAERFIREIYAMNRRLGIPSDIPELREEDVTQLARYAEHEANPLYPVPVLWDRKKIEIIYRKAVSTSGC